MTIRKMFGQIHLWLGLASGAVVVVLGITGCFYCFEKELKDIFYAERVFTDETTSTAALPLDDLKRAAQSALGSAYPINGIEFKPNTNRAYKFRAFKYNGDAVGYDEQYPYYKTAFVNPRTAAVIAIEDTKWEFFQIVLCLHYDLMLGKIGHHIVSWSCLMFVVLLMSGFVLWLPKQWSNLKQRVTIAFRGSWKRVNYDLHNVPGFYSLALASLISLTGLFFAFDWFKFLTVMTVSGGQFQREKPVQSDTSQTGFASLESLYRSTFEQVPDGQVYFIVIPDKPVAPVRVISYPHSNDYLERSQFFYDQFTGKLLRAKPYIEATSAEKLTLMIYDLHVGKFFGLPTQLLAFFASLVSASLPVTGFIIWLGRRRKARRETAVKSQTPASELVEA